MHIACSPIPRPLARSQLQVIINQQMVNSSLKQESLSASLAVKTPKKVAVFAFPGVKVAGTIPSMGWSSTFPCSIRLVCNSSGAVHCGITGRKTNPRKAHGAC